MRRFASILAMLAALNLAGCAGVALTAGGIAGSAGVNHTLSGIVYKTFTAPLKDMRIATLKTLNRMQIKVTADKKAEYGWRIDGTAFERTIEIELERLTPAATRMRVTTNKGSIFKDSATSTEIILQTARRLENTKRRKQNAKQRQKNTTQRPANTKKPRHSHTSGSKS
ncbi:MAG: DUF3568 family protein [Alphaproteobacteria bacterium]|nr:MAG: DUF3568 family protein [Alphaproteobacteria bacterium]